MPAMMQLTAAHARVARLEAALREMRDIARHFANVAGHPDDAVAIEANKRAAELMKECGL